MVRVTKSLCGLSLLSDINPSAIFDSENTPSGFLATGLLMFEEYHYGFQQ
jgi:hypothetical protein